VPKRQAWADDQSNTASSTNHPDLVGVRDGSPAQMFETGIEALGGMKRFVKNGQTVLVKPNIGWNKAPNQGANTNPDLVGKIVESAYKAGASKVMVFDHCVNLMEECYRNSGIRAAVEQAGGKLYPSDEKKYYRHVKIPGAKVLKDAHVHDLYLDADVVINVPVLKNHMSTGMTACMKNLMGVVWDRRAWHGSHLQQCIADFLLLREVQLNIVDAYTVMVKNGPRGHAPDDLLVKKIQILSPDMVLADAAAAKTLGVQPGDIKHVMIADSMELGSMNLEDKNVKRISCRA
jgi:uncharacterized protein (DUF362 family)